MYCKIHLTGFISKFSLAVVEWKILPTGFNGKFSLAIWE